MHSKSNIETGLTLIKGWISRRQRKYPKIQTGIRQPTRPISFICVKYSDEFRYNIITSQCVHDDLNEFIVVDNRSDIFFQTLGQAINAGIAQARHDLLVIVHEDVVLRPGWHEMFEESLTALEQHDPDWLLVGVVGWDENERLVGHCSDPHGFWNTFGAKPFVRAARIDEQVLVLRKSKCFFPDPDLPSIHNIGRDMVWDAARLGVATYVINAPSVHKYADATGRLVLGAEDSKKIKNRKTLTYIHNKECSDEYLEHKWKERFGDAAAFNENLLTDQQIAQLNSPVILLGSGGAGTRLISVMASDIGLFIGNEINPAGDCLEMVGPIYRAVFRKNRCPSEWQKSLIVPDLRASAYEMLKKASWPSNWGFKLPENLLIIQELRAAFPRAKYVLLMRDPLTTVLRRPHMTARLDNEIGRTALPLAYNSAGLPREEILLNSAAVRMARTTAHQIGLVMEFKSSVPANHWHNISFESLMAGSRDVLNEFADFCDREVVSDRVFLTIDRKRAFRSSDEFSSEDIDAVNEILRPTRRAMGYL